MASSAPLPGICDIPLVYGYKTSNSPSIIVFTTTIGFYFLNGLWNGGPTATENSWLAVLIFVGFACVQSWVIYYQSVKFNKCPPTVWYGVLFAFIFGALFGTITYWVSAALNKNTSIQAFTNYKEKFTEQSGFNAIAFPGGSPSELAAAAKAKASGQPTTGITGQCLQKSAESDEYVCDVYKNGQLVTKTITE